MAPASVYIWLYVCQTEVGAKPKKKKSYLQNRWPLIQRQKYMALQCVNMAREPVTNKYSVVLIKKLRLSVTKQTFKQKTTLQGSESAESH